MLILRTLGIMAFLAIGAKAVDNSEDFLEIPNNQGLVLYKISGKIPEAVQKSLEEEDLLDEDSDEDSTDVLAYPLSSPFGTYIVFSNENRQIPIAMQIIFERRVGGVLGGDCATDVLKNYQGQGYGSKLRRATANYLKNFMINSQSDENNIHPSLSYLRSVNEWRWGENLESLKSALSADFRIVCIDKFNFINLFYVPVDDSSFQFWPPMRTDYLLKIANMIRNPNKYILTNGDNLEIINESFKLLLEDLDLNLPTDQETLAAFWLKLVRENRSASLDPHSPGSAHPFKWYETFGETFRNYMSKKGLQQLQSPPTGNRYKKLSFDLPDQKEDLKRILEENFNDIFSAHIEERLWRAGY